MNSDTSDRVVRVRCIFCSVKITVPRNLVLFGAHQHDERGPYACSSGNFNAIQNLGSLEFSDAQCFALGQNPRSIDPDIRAALMGQHH
jgi:hypothetical protein